MMTASLLAAQSISASRRSGARTTPVGHWWAGVSTTAPAPDASRAATSTPRSSTGTGPARGAGRRGPGGRGGDPGRRAAAGDQIAFREQLGVALLHQAAGQAQCFGQGPRRRYPVPGTEPAGPDRLPELVLKLSPQRDAAAAVEGEENLGRQTGPFHSHATGPYRKSSRCLPSSV